MCSVAWTLYVEEVVGLLGSTEADAVHPQLWLGVLHRPLSQQPARGDGLATVVAVHRLLANLSTQKDSAVLDGAAKVRVHAMIIFIIGINQLIYTVMYLLQSVTSE